MKLNYFGYCLTNIEDGRTVTVDLRPLLTAFAAHASVDIKNSFRRDGETLYLLHNVGDVFLFVITRSNEILRRVNRTDASVADINDLLQQNEHLGFASYILMNSDFFSFGSTLLAPKFNVFTHFVNDLLTLLGLHMWQFVPQAIVHTSTKESIVSMDFIGKTKIEVSRENNLFQDLIALATGDASTVNDVDSFEITIKPRSRHNIKETVAPLLSRIDTQGLDKVITSAKMDAHDRLTELYLNQSGAVTDLIDAKRWPEIPGKMTEKANNNTLLTQRLNEYRTNGQFSQESIERIDLFSLAESWANFVLPVQVD